MAKAISGVGVSNLMSQNTTTLVAVCELKLCECFKWSSCEYIQSWKHPDTFFDLVPVLQIPDVSNQTLVFSCTSDTEFCLSSSLQIALGTVTNVEEAVKWISYTYLYVRMRANPLVYGISHKAYQV